MIRRLALVLLLASLVGCSHQPPRPGEPPPGPSILSRLWTSAQPLVGQLAHEVLDWALGKAFGPPQVQAGSARAARVRSRSSETASASIEEAALQLELVRSWRRPAGLGQRVRLAAGPDGHLLVAWMERLGGRRYRAVLEDAAGQVLQEHLVQAGIPEFFPALVAGAELLVRDQDRLLFGGVEVGQGAFEAYAGMEALAVGWAPCAKRPCPAAIVHGSPEGWMSRTWSVELFGVDLAPAASGTVAIASREQPNSSGWTLRMVDEAALRRGEVLELRRETWRPARGLSLEDPQLVRGAAVPMLVGEAYQLPGYGKPEGPTGRAFLAEQGGQLEEVLQAGATKLNAGLGAAVLNGRLYLATETGGDRSGLWRWRVAGGLELLGEVTGGAPSLAAAEGQLWISSAAGLWRLQ